MPARVVRTVARPRVLRIITETQLTCSLSLPISHMSCTPRTTHRDRWYTGLLIRLYRCAGIYSYFLYADICLG